VASEPVPMRREQQRRDGLPPHDLAAEEAVLAACLLDDDAVPRCEAIVQAQDFFREHNGWAYDACLAVWRRGEEVTVPAVAHELERMGRAAADGHVDHASWGVDLVDIVGKYFTAVGVETHARIIARDALYRRLIQTASHIAARAYEGGSDESEVMRDCEAMLVGIQVGNRKKGLVPIADVATLLIQNGGVDAQRVTSGFPTLDRYAGGGLALGQLSLVGGRRHSAKSAYAMGAVWRQARSGVRAAYLQFEDTPQNATVRLAGQLVLERNPGRSWGGLSYMERRRDGEIPGAPMRPGEWTDFEVAWGEALMELAEMDTLLLVDPGGLPTTFEELEMFIRHAALRYGTQVFYLDYVSMFPRLSPDFRGLTTADVLDQMMSRLATLAVRLGVHICVLSQVSNEGRDAQKNPAPAEGLYGSGGLSRQPRFLMMIGLDSDNQSGHQVPLLARIETLKAVSMGDMVELRFPDGRNSPALYLDTRTGIVRDHWGDVIDQREVGD